jgi:hypothetical protein
MGDIQIPKAAQLFCNVLCGGFSSAEIESSTFTFTSGSGVGDNAAATG